MGRLSLRVFVRAYLPTVPAKQLRKSIEHVVVRSHFGTVHGMGGGCLTTHYGHPVLDGGRWAADLFSGAFCPLVFNELHRVGWNQRCAKVCEGAALQCIVKLMLR